MTTIAARDLRNRTADVLRQVSEGTPVTITVNGAPIADLVAHRGRRQSSLARAELIDILRRHPADSGLRSDLELFAGDDTDDLGPLP